MGRLARIETTVRWLAGSVIRRDGVVCLNYHRIGDGRASPFDRGLWSATVDGFDEQVRWLKAEFDVVSPADLPEIVRRRRGRHALVTFDDGYEDNHRLAYPVLRAHRVPATFFVTTGFIDDGWRLPWWDEIAWIVRTSTRSALTLRQLERSVALRDDREPALRALRAAIRRLPRGETEGFLDALGDAAGTGRFRRSAERLWMTWDMLREMRAGGMTIGGHTVTHAMLSRLTRDDQRREIAGCGARLAVELGAPMLTFSYPFGKPGTFDEVTRACLRESGVRSAFTYHGGFRRLGAWDDYDVPRSEVEQDTTFERFRAEALAPWLPLTRR